MNKKELDQWWKMRKQLVNGWHMSHNDVHELVRLNNLVMEATHYIHNENMGDRLPKGE